MKKMEHDLNDKVANLLKTTSELDASRMEVSKMSEIAMRDALTGVRNKRAYDNDMQVLEQSLNDGSDGASDFGLAVIDLNSLKQINDTYGHEKGDMAIKKLCSIVCSVFAHSPVYRIGGDEFTVILKGQDLNNVEKLMNRFNDSLLDPEQNDGLAPWGKVTAAIGYAVFDSDKDETPSGTFRRADREMYLQKQKTKTNHS